eukprot:2113772-Pleurochrysis_carterae.AAC.3
MSATSSVVAITWNDRNTSANKSTRPARAFLSRNGEMNASAQHNSVLSNAQEAGLRVFKDSGLHPISGSKLVDAPVRAFTAAYI